MRAADAGPTTVVRNQAGDDPRWAEPGWDDSTWEQGGTMPSRSGVHWVRFRFRLPDGVLITPVSSGTEMTMAIEDGGPIDCVRVSAPCAFDFYWDGHRIGGSGKVGRTREEEVVGPLDSVFPVPRELLGPGEHVVAMRVSSFHYNFAASTWGTSFAITSYQRLLRNDLRRAFSPLVGFGGALLVTVMSAVLYLTGERWRPLLLCSALSLSLALFYLLVSMRWIYNLPYDWFAPRLAAATLAMTAVAWLFPWMLLEQFQIRRRVWWLGATAALLAFAWQLSPVYEYKCLWLCRTMLGVSLAISLVAVWRRQRGARWVLAAVLGGLLIVRASRQEFLGPTFFATFGGLVLAVFATQGAQLRAQRRQAQEARLTTARLELELLKKNLQPHFLLNTLAVLTEIVDRDPRAATTLIEDLAEEFRSLNRVAEEKLISLDQEIRLCRAHLRVMSARTSQAWQIETNGQDLDVPVPPAVFLTLIENGFTHQHTAAPAPAFVLRTESRPAGCVRHIFLSPGSVQSGARSSGGGTGLRYVRARLEESFPGRWTLRNGPTTGGWETVIEYEIPGTKGRS